MSNDAPPAKALVIVDMQSDFLDRMGDGESCNDSWVSDCYRKLLKGILREVKKAKKMGQPIICLQYANQEDGFEHPKQSWMYHATIEEIRFAVRDYPNVYFAWKDDDDGSEMVLDVLKGVEPRLGLDTLTYKGNSNKLRKFITNENKKIKFTVCGVNADACVLSTCCGLIENDHKCVVPADAAMNVWDCSFGGNGELTHTPGIKVVKPRKPKSKKLAA